ncbi:MAG: HEAT repeat domain-containing protein [Capsulimonadaceae bacterium]
MNKNRRIVVGLACLLGPLLTVLLLYNVDSAFHAEVQRSLTPLRPHDATARESALRLQVIGTLTSALSSDDARTRWAAADALGAMRSPAGVPALVQTLKDPDAHVRLDVVHALGLIGAPSAPAIPALSDALSDADGDVRNAAAGSLGDIFTSLGNVASTNPAYPVTVGQDMETARKALITARDKKRIDAVMANECLNQASAAVQRIRTRQ